jgi:hypothetical protein
MDTSRPHVYAPASKATVRTRQRGRIAECPWGTWPETYSDVTDAGDMAAEWREADLRAVERLVRDTSGDQRCPEYGVRYLSMYRDLRDLLYQVSGPDSTDDFSADTRPLIDTLWERYRALRGHEALSTMPFAFPRVAESAPADPTDPHDDATAELAKGYDFCIARAQEEWTAARADSADGNGGTPSAMDALGAHLADWGMSFAPGTGLERRWAVYAAEDDPAFTGWLARLRPRRECHLKDALLMEMSPHEVVETVLLPCTGMFSDSPAGAGYAGEEAWPNSLLVCLTVWADYAGAKDAESSAGRGAFDMLAPAASALAGASGPAADEIKATIVTLYGAKMGLFRPAAQSCTAMWRSRGYDGAVHSSVAALALTRGLVFEGGGLSERCLDIGAAVMAVHDCVDCEADVTNRTAGNLILIAAHQGTSVESILDTVYATVAANWAATDVYGQILLAAVSEQAGGSRWGGPVYAAESRTAGCSADSNLWTNSLSPERIAALRTANILPTTVDELSTIQPGASWHETALAQSRGELLAQPVDDADEPASPTEVLAFSKGTLTLICCASCAECGQDRRLRLDSWAGEAGTATTTRIMHRVRRIRRTVDKTLERLRAQLRSDSRPDAIYRLTAEATMAGTPESRYLMALLEALTIEDALYHGTDLLSYCAGWLSSDPGATRGWA